MQDLSQQFIGLSEAARALGLSVEMARRLVDDGVLDAIRTPYGRMVRRESVAAEVERRRKRREWAHES